MIVAVPSEHAESERRVALTPDAVTRLAGGGLEILVQSGAGNGASIRDAEYEAAGARIAPDAAALLAEADMLVLVTRPTEVHLEGLRTGSALVGMLQPLTNRDLVDALAARGLTAFSLDAVPRITRSQSMDALSSQATVSGYKAVLIAASMLPRFFPMLMTAAGTVAPAKVLVLGAGVAGLQAIATARRLGAVVSAFDTRPVVKEQVQSLGATFVELALEVEEGQDARGYATELSESQHAQEQAMIERQVTASDVVITTALIPGRPAPRLITAGAVSAMRTGSVIVDLAAETGGNCELTRPGEVAEAHGVTIVGLTNLPGTMPADASRLLSRNVQALLQHLAPDGELVLDFDDEITAGACVVRPKEVAA